MGGRYLLKKGFGPRLIPEDAAGEMDRHPKLIAQ